MNAVIVQPDRTAFLGGSDIAAVLGISPWKTPLALYKDKTEPQEDKQGRKVKRRGHRWEAVVSEMLVESLEDLGHTVEIVARNQRYVDPDITYFACEIDFELKLDGADEITNCELKTVHPFKSKEWGEEGSDEAPLHYIAQTTWGLGITRRRSAIIAALFGADEIKPYFAPADNETIAAIRQRGCEFWNEHVLPRVPPDPRTVEDVDLLYAKGGDNAVLIADDELTKKYLRLAALKHEIKAREAEYEAFEFEVKCAMGIHSELAACGKTAVTWKNRATSILDQSALKEAHPKLVREFTRKGEARYFTVK